MAQALRDGTGFTEIQVPGMVGRTFFGKDGDVGMWLEFLEEHNAIVGLTDKSTNDRLTRIVTRADELAEESPDLVVGRLKAEIAGLIDAEVLFIVSYLYVGRKILARPDEAPPAPPVLVVQAAQPTPGGPRRVAPPVVVTTTQSQSGNNGQPALQARARAVVVQPPAQPVASTEPPVRVTGVLVDLDAVVVSTPPARSFEDEETAEVVPAPKKLLRAGPQTREATPEEMGWTKKSDSSVAPEKEKPTKVPILGIAIGLLALAVFCCGTPGLLYLLFN